jgi:hypothetical protein
MTNTKEDGINEGQSEEMSIKNGSTAYSVIPAGPEKEDRMRDA